jgi:hypothetical protein
MTSCTYDMPRSACSFALETYHGASTIILRILDRLLWIIDIIDLLAQPHNSRPYVQICMIMVLWIRSLFSIARFDFLHSSQFNCLMVMLTCFRFLTVCVRTLWGSNVQDVILFARCQGRREHLKRIGRRRGFDVITGP